MSAFNIQLFDGFIPGGGKYFFPVTAVEGTGYAIFMSGECLKTGKPGSVRANVSMLEIPKPGFSLVKNVTFKAKFAEMKQQSSLNDGG